jgi:hypothetical protein
VWWVVDGLRDASVERGAENCGAIESRLADLGMPLFLGDSSFLYNRLVYHENMSISDWQWAMGRMIGRGGREHGKIRVGIADEDANIYTYFALGGGDEWVWDTFPGHEICGIDRRVENDVVLRAPVEGGEIGVHSCMRKKGEGFNWGFADD